MAETQKAPPATIPGKQTLKKSKTQLLDIDLQIEIVRDAVDSNVRGGETRFSTVGAIGREKSLYRLPGYEWKQQGPQKIITKFAGPVEIKGIINIQTLYSPKAKADDPSAYGRGTTQEDKDAGNTSLGFHESCHRDDFIKYLKSKPLPTPAIRVGMTEQQYEQEGQAFARKLEAYFKAMDADSEKHTDEVGLKKSEYNRGATSR